MLFLVEGLLRRFWPPLALALGTVLFSGLRQAAPTDTHLDQIILGLITVLMGYLALRKDSSGQTITSLSQTIASLKETVEAYKLENTVREQQLAEAQRAHGAELSTKIDESQETILKALQATARSNTSRLDQLERKVEIICGSMDKTALLAQQAYAVATAAVRYRDAAIEDLLKAVETLDCPAETKALIDELKQIVGKS